MRNNKEIRIVIHIWLIIIILGFFSYKITTTKKDYVFLFTCFSIIGAFLIFTSWRYKKLADLSDYLSKICSGNYDLDIRDNVEGELSILKSEIYKVTLMLREKNELLQKDKLYLSNAMSDISHQLKTPLTSMMMMSDFLREENLPIQKRMEFTRHLKKQLERMEWLVSSLLKLAKLDVGAVIFKKEKIVVENLINEAIKPFLISMEIKEQKFIMQINNKRNFQESFIGDKNWCIEAVTNILKNCIEHTDVGGELKISCEENSIYTLINIEDNGEGIEKEDLPYIFERFYRGKNASTDSVGIGLAMAKEIFIKQNAKIDVKSKKGMGTKFFIKIYKTDILNEKTKEEKI